MANHGHPSGAKVSRYIMNARQHWAVSATLFMPGAQRAPQYRFDRSWRMARGAQSSSRALFSNASMTALVTLPSTCANIWSYRIFRNLTSMPSCTFVPWPFVGLICHRFFKTSKIDTVEQYSSPVASTMPRLSSRSVMLAQSSCKLKGS